jgi:hypothetical protein
MRRSVRDAIVGFTVLGGLVGFAATGMWMRGHSLGLERLETHGEFQMMRQDWPSVRR